MGCMTLTLLAITGIFGLFVLGATVYLDWRGEIRIA
jgi:hypothetical protein